MSRSFGSNAPPGPQQWRQSGAHDPSGHAQQAPQPNQGWPQPPAAAPRTPVFQQPQQPPTQQQPYVPQPSPLDYQQPASTPTGHQHGGMEPRFGTPMPQTPPGAGAVRHAAPPPPPAEPRFQSPPYQPQQYQPQPYPAATDPFHTDGGVTRPLPGHDAGGYDLGSYGVPPASIAPATRRGGQPDAINWPSEPPGHEYQQAAHQPHGYAAADPYAAQQGHGQRDQDVELDDDYDYEEEPRGSRRWLIVAALVGSIAVGGGMAYGYKAWTSKSPSARTAQVVKAPQGPVRVAPADPGGRKFAGADDKFANRLPPASGGEVAAAGTVDSSGVRRVPTVRVGPDMTVAAPPVSAAPPVGVPGMTIVGGSGMPGGPAPSTLSQMQAMPPPAQAMSPPAPRMTATVPAAEPPRQLAAVRAAPPPQQRPVRKPAAAAEATAAVAPAAKAPRVRTSGFVTVLGYQKGRMEALRMMADLQQRYALLQGQKLDVIESDQTARGLGVIYRVVAGPPSPRADATALCKQLQENGFKGCWAMAR